MCEASYSLHQVSHKTPFPSQQLEGMLSCPTPQTKPVAEIIMIQPVNGPFQKVEMVSLRVEYPLLTRCSTTETVEGTALALESIDDVERSDSLTLGVLGVGDSVANDSLQEGL